MRANLCRVQNGQNGFPLRSLCVQLKCSLQTASNNKEIYNMKWTLQPLPQARIQASEKRMTPTNLLPRVRISQEPKRSSLQSQVKRNTKTTRSNAISQFQFSILLYLLSNLPTYFSASYIQPLHTEPYIHSPLTFQSLPAFSSYYAFLMCTPPFIAL